MANKFQPITLDEVADVLDTTIKFDKTNKLVTFLCMLSAYTEDSQFNVSFNAPSSTGKSYIAMETSKLFPIEDVAATGHSSPTAFLYQRAEQIDDAYHIDLERKIVVFLDQRDTQTLARLRSLLSHDAKEITFSMTDHTQKVGRRTKNIIVHGHAAFINCSAGQKMDMQEASRFLLISPEITQEKLRSGIDATISKESNPDAFQGRINANEKRNSLMERIKAIREVHNEEIVIPNEDDLRKRFFDENRLLQPRHQRDIKWLIALIKTHALLNCWFRGEDPKRISANDEDLAAAWALWSELSESQTLSLTPYVHQVYKRVIRPLLVEHSAKDIGVDFGVTRQDIAKRYKEVEGGNLDIRLIREEILPALEHAGLIRQERSSSDRRQMLVLPTFENQLDTRNGPTDQGTEVSGVASENQLINPDAS